MKKYKEATTVIILILTCHILASCTKEYSREKTCGKVIGLANGKAAVQFAGGVDSVSNNGTLVIGQTICK